MEDELLRLYGATGETGVFPSRAREYFKVDGVHKDLSAEGYFIYWIVKVQEAEKYMAFPARPLSLSEAEQPALRA